MSPSEPMVLRGRRLNDLLGLDVVDEHGDRLGWVSDVRLAPGPTVRGVLAELVVDGIVVDGRHAGALLGYDRRADQGPWLVRVVVRRLHRHAGYLAWSSIRRIDWAGGRVEVSGPPGPLTSP